MPDNVFAQARLRMAQAITIRDIKTGGTGTMLRAIEEGRERAGVELISKRTANARAEDPTNADD